MKTKLSFKETLLVASLLFGMLFGAGNLIFPVHMGQLAGENYFPSVVGFVITAVGFPLLGIVALGITKTNNVYELSKFVGDPYNKIFTIALYLTIGPFFAIPRCASTSYTIGMQNIIPENMHTVGLFIFSIFFFVVVLFFSLKPTKILDYIGKFINPIFLITFFILIIVSLSNPTINVHEVSAQGDYATIPFFKGILEGYNTMDAIATLAFGITIIEVVKSLGINDTESITKSIIKSSVIASILMCIIYFLSTLMGAGSRGILAVSENGGIALSDLSLYYLGDFGNILLLVIVTLACVKTSIGLVTSISSMFEEISNHKIKEKTWAIIFTVFSFIIANFGLTNIISFAIPVLYLLYPLTITLSLLGIFGKFFNYRKQVFRIVTAVAFVFALFDCINALPQNIISMFNLSFVIDFAKNIPFFNLGIAWVIPSLIAFVVALVYCHFYVDDIHSETY